MAIYSFKMHASYASGVKSDKKCMKNFKLGVSNK